jgi:hemoglobin-like flavoprotein
MDVRALERRPDTKHDTQAWSSVMTPEDKRLLKETWGKVVPIADTAAQLFYSRLFEIDPSTRPLFTATDMGEQRKKLMQTIAVAVQGLDNLDALIPVVEKLGRRHRGYGVSDAHYASVGGALLWTLEKGLGAAWTPAAAAAWTELYGALSGAMRRAAAEEAA